ncbi:MAG: T9SS type A sorting domain-containing protein [Flavobacteriales bacterium]
MIHPGATLTVKCGVFFGTQAKVDIMPGGRLIVEGGNLSSLDGDCYSFWPGIRVWGDNAQNQFPENNPSHQGIIILIDATIENAREAISTWGDGWDTFGGVVRATNTVFKNCRRSAQFMAYQNTINGQPYRNHSYFTGCTFTVDNAYRGNEDFYAHVSMWGTDGITFDACAFENLSTAIYESHKRGHGIISIDASYTVDGICAVMPPDGSFCHENDLMRSRFTGLDHGINARNATTARGFIVRGSLFEDNICGVYAEGVTGFQITNNVFEVGGSEATMTNLEEDNWFERHRAVFSTNSWGFAIDDNTLIQDGAHAETEGIVVGYSRDHNDLVFRNSASGLERAYIGEGICADLDETYTMLRGLQFICNENNGNTQNFWSRKVDADEIENPLTHTIRTNQGDYYRPADNTFDQVPGPEGVADYEVTTENGNITYWHRNTGTFVPIHVRQSVVPPTYIGPAPATQIPANNCASKVLATIPYDEDHESGMMLQPIVDYLLAEKLAYGNTRYLYEQLIDGGSTDEVVGEITAAWPQDAWDLRDYLLSLSPYLSVAALKEAMDKEWFPDAMRAQICIANPDATKKEGFLDWLRNECLYPLPEYMLASIVASWESQTYRTALEAEMAHHHAEMSQAANLLIHRHHWDENGAQPAEVRAVWQLLRTPAARYAEALTWLQEGNYTQADAVIRDIPDEHDLKAPEMLERQRMRDLIAILLAVHADARSEAQLTTGEVEALQVLIVDAHDRPATLASNLLCFHYQHCRAPLTSGEPGGPKSRVSSGSRQNAKGSGGMLLIHPNPASSWVAIDYDLLGEPVDAAIAILDLAGREVKRLKLIEPRLQVVLDTRELSPGSYTVVLNNSGHQLHAEKLIIRQ